MTDECRTPSNPSPDRQPLMHELFELVARRRDERLRYDLTDTHVEGFEELFNYLDTAVERFAQHPVLAQVVVLVRRVRADFETGLFAFLSGLDQATFDEMRDVMEIEYLLREFLHEPASINQWLSATDDDRWRIFGPGQLRRRHADRLRVPVADLVDTAEYRAHSGMLHVGPEPSWPIERGVSKSDHPEFGAAFALADLLHHARDSVYLLYILAERAVPPLRLDQDPGTGLPHLQRAFEETMRRYHNASMWIDLASVVAEHRRDAAAEQPT